MHDELERTAESPAVSSARTHAAARLEMLDVAGAIASAERFASSRVFGDETGNGDLSRAITEGCALAEKGERASLIAPAERFGTMRDALRRAASARIGIVAHAIAGHGAEDLAALADLGWGVLTSSGPEDSFDLTLVAHRAAEDSGVPFIVMHGLGRAAYAAGRAVAMVGIPHEKTIQAFVGPTPAVRAKMALHGDGGGAGALAANVKSGGDRAFAERVPFALGAALREYGSVSGRRHDAFDKIPLGESPLVIVGMGPVGDALFCATGELRARGYDVGAIHVTSLRPFPGPRLVKALARALAVTVLEAADEPLTHGALLARDVKSAFTDALTWAPGFPGIGRIPKLFIGASGSAFDISDLAAVCENMLADERGRRVFSFVDVEHALPRATRSISSSSSSPSSSSSSSGEPTQATQGVREIAIRCVLDDAASAEVVLAVLGATMAQGVGLRTHGIITASTHGSGAVVDVVASRDHARGGMARRAPRLVITTKNTVASAGAVVALHEGAILGVVGGDPSAILPEAARTVVRERRARVLPLALGDGGDPATAIAAVVAGAVLAAASRALKTPIDGGAAARYVSDAVAQAEKEVSAPRARHAFEATRDVLAAAARDEPDAHAARPIGVA